MRNATACNVHVVRDKVRLAIQLDTYDPVTIASPVPHERLHAYEALAGGGVVDIGSCLSPK
jgi:hypothetical protein